MPLLFLLALVGFWVWWLVTERNRRKGLLALAEKYNLEINPSRPVAPDPDIRSWFFAASYVRYMQGRFHGVPVFSFDYRIGLKGNYGGSGVGVQRPVLSAPATSRGLILKRAGDWCFLYTWPLFRHKLRLDANDIERLWDQLLVAPADGPERASFGEDVPGGIVIRPVKLSVGL